MAPTLPPTSGSLKAALADWQRRVNREIVSRQSLSGSGNRSYLIQDNHNAQYVLRINGETEYLGVNRARELQILNLIKSANIAATCVHQGAKYCVFEYLEPPGEPDERGIATQLGCLHELVCDPWSTKQPRWNPTHTIEDYLEQLPAAKPFFSSALAELNALDWSAQHYGICHVDLNPANILATSVGIRFIDWEYARYGPTIYDLAVLLETFPTLNEQALLDHYSLEAESSWLRHNRRAYRLIECLWFALTDPGSWSIDRLEIEAGLI